MNYVGRTCDHGIIYTCATLYKQHSGCFDAKNDVLCPRCKKSIVEGDWQNDILMIYKTLYGQLQDMASQNSSICPIDYE